ncbi:hypothetical protein C8F04DRAFT_1115872 [Mycena alexandri]|uniref:G-patch domain-containing protein n=1 Tax=Mycena alexandri TaxID=1745969 RepID=A0AAD6SLQ9_9AGAR|nr:hypothetical protein C8F04DRAFT_1121211 [Mycena alexandri]KAJ7029786.1 hypothetical protein C8F04DRAFT_1115872 [Mycena alexandri]
MSSRLKKKLGNLGIDPSSAKANESFCLIGTPLPPLEKSKDNGEFVPLWKQDVRDEQGRRRLHGAFTGGFSAGYFNSVGSKEGWTPSAFVSSRGDRSKKKASRPEDFMDEEDLQELRDSRDVVDTTDEMDLASGIQTGHGDDEEQDSVARALEASMLPAAKDSAGARILKKMGWRIGQGIGPRVTLRQRKLQDLQAVSDRRGVVADAIIPDDDEEEKKHTYAPRDTPILTVERKDNSHGLGYHPGMGLNESVGGKSGAASGPKLASGFGLGALNDADEDDLDVYDGGFAQNRNRTAYDIIDREEEEKISIGGKADSRGRTTATPASSTHTFHDGKPVLAGFVLSEKPVAEDRWFPLPDIPKGWKPDPKRVWDKENAQTPETSSQAPPDNWSRSGISADQRGSLLGETPLPAAPRSVFEFMSQKDRERLKNIASGGPPVGGASADAPSASSSRPAPATITIAHTEPHIAVAALRGGFAPFATNPNKQARYTAYLESQATTDTPPPPPQPLPGQKIDEFNKELEDYAKAALIFKPLSGAMAGRFTSASIVEHGPKIHEGLYTPSAEDLARKEAELQKIEEEKVSPKVHAARMGMYGPMTRETQPWQPAKLLCKRFRVKDPNPPAETPADGPPQAAYAEPSSAAPGMGWDQFTAPAGESTAETSTASGGRRDLSNIGLGEDEAQGRDTLTYQRPAMDVFKAIFASDDEDSDDETKEDAKDDKDDEPPPAVEPADATPAAPTPAADVAMPDASELAVVDIGTFKPTFIPREGKAKRDSDRSKDKKDKKEKKKKEKVLVSFQEDEEDGPLQISVRDRPKKKRRKDKQPEEEESMWVVKAAPAVVKEFPIPPPSAAMIPEIQPSEAPGSKGRKRAIDFM